MIVGYIYIDGQLLSYVRCHLDTPCVSQNMHNIQI